MLRMCCVLFVCYTYICTCIVTEQQQLVELFTPESAYTTLLPLTFHLLADPVCVVREVTLTIHMLLSVLVLVLTMLLIVTCYSAIR
jgi:hypothetical protein